MLTSGILIAGLAWLTKMTLAFSAGIAVPPARTQPTATTFEGTVALVTDDQIVLATSQAMYVNQRDAWRNLVSLLGINYFFAQISPDYASIATINNNQILIIDILSGQIIEGDFPQITPLNARVFWLQDASDCQK